MLTARRGGRWSFVTDRPLLAITLLFSALSLLALLANAPGVYVPDTRFENYWAGLDVLGRHRYVWDDVRSLGAPTVFYTPAVAVYLALTDVLSLPPWLSERLLHVAYLVAGGLGMVQVLRIFTPRTSAMHVVAGLIFMFNPLTTQFLLPSGIFSHYSLAPWLLVAFAHGVRGRSPWRWAAIAALATFTVGALNLPSLVYAALPLLTAAAYFLWVDRTTTARAIGGWSLRAGLLIGLMSLPGLIVTGLNEPRFRYNLATTELPSAVSRLSSWFESWRGLGSWLTYIRRLDGAFFRPEVLSYFESALVIVATFAVPILALYALARIPWRPKVLFGGLLVTGLVAMVALFPVGNDAFPLGGWLADLSEDSPLAASFRNGYKAGPAWAMGVAALAAMAIMRLQHLARSHWDRHPVRAGRLAMALLVGVVGVASFPYWTGQLYSSTNRVRTVPDYWYEATDYLDDQPGDGSVLVLPGANYARFRWGHVGDDIFDGLLRRTHVVRSGLTQGTTETAELIYALDDYATGGRYEPGVIPGLARRLGIQWVVLRNDLDWETLQIPRPSNLDRVRADPGLEEVATFGELGENVVDPAAAPVFADVESELPPVEIYEVRDARSATQVADADAPLLVSGGGEAWIGLGRRDLLDTSPPVAFTGALDSGQVLDFLEAGAAVRITDTNRRRVRQISSERNFSSHTLRAGEDLQRPPPVVYDGAGTESVAYIPGDIEITSSNPVARSEVGQRPANAFDQSRLTSWSVPWAIASGAWIDLELPEEVIVPRVRLVPLDPGPGQLRVGRVEVRLSGGESVVVDLGSGVQEVELPPVPTRSITVTVESLIGAGRSAVGFREIEVAGIDTRERVQLPDDLSRMAAAEPALEAALAAVPLTYSFDRSVGTGFLDEEGRIARRFHVLTEDEYQLDGVIRVGPTAPDVTVDRLIGAERGAVASDRFQSQLRHGGVNVVDGDATTRWQALPSPGQSLRVRFPRQLVDTIDLRGLVRADQSTITGLTLTAGEPDSTPVEVSLPADCRGRSDRHCTLAVPPVTTGAITVSVTDVDLRFEGREALPIGIGEVNLGDRWPPFPEEVAPGAATCRPGGTVDGQRFPIRYGASHREAMEGRPIAFSACRPFSLDEGWHDLFIAPELDGAVDRADLRRTRTGDEPDGGARQSAGRSLWPGAVDATVPAGSDGFLLGGAPFQPDWSASSPLTDAGPVPLDTQIAWGVQTDRPLAVEIRFGPQRAYELGLLVALATLVACAAHVAMTRQKSPTMNGGRPARVPVGAVGAGAMIVGLGGVGWLFGGIGGLAIAATAAHVARLRPRIVLHVALIGLALTAGLVLVEGAGLSGGGVFVLSRPLTEDVARSVGLLVIAGLVGTATRERAVTASAISTADRRLDPRRLLVPVSLGALLGGAFSALSALVLPPIVGGTVAVAGIVGLAMARRERSTVAA